MQLSTLPVSVPVSSVSPSVSASVPEPRVPTLSVPVEPVRPTVSSPELLGPESASPSATVDAVAPALPPSVPAVAVEVPPLDASSLTGGGSEKHPVARLMRTQATQHCSIFGSMDGVYLQWESDLGSTTMQPLPGPGPISTSSSS